MKKILVVAAGLCVLVAFSAGVASADCPDAKIACVKIVNGKINRDNKKGVIATGSCYKGWPTGCRLCDSNAAIAGKCNAQVTTCEGSCAACVGDTTGNVAAPCYDKNGAQIPW